MSLRVPTFVSVVTVLLTMLLAASVAWGDVIWIGTGAGRGLRQEVSVVGVEDDQLVYTLLGNRATTALDRVQQIELRGERQFNEAEQAFIAGDWARASDGYAQVAPRHPQTWVRRRSAERLVDAASRAGRFEQAVTGYVQLTLLAPAAAPGRQPPITDALTDAQLQAAARQVEEALRGRLEPQQERALLAFQLDLHTRRGDDEAAGRVIERLSRVLGSNDDPRLLAQVALGRADLAAAAGRYDDARRAVDEARRVLVQPAHQARALLILAAAAEADAGDDRDALLDAVVAFVEVAAHFKDVPEASTSVAEALVRAGDVHARLNLPDAAAGLYRDVLAGFPESPAAAVAQQRLAEAAGE